MSAGLPVDEEDLAVSLWAHGVRVLSLPSEPRADVEGASMPVPTLAARLASSSSPLLRSCLPVLLLVHGERAGEIRSGVAALSCQDARRLQTLYTIAVCLQRLWWTRLHLSTSAMPRLEDTYSAELGLPDPERMFGRACLAAIDVGLVEDCERTLAVFLEEREREHRLAETAGGRE